MLKERKPTEEERRIRDWALRAERGGTPTPLRSPPPELLPALGYATRGLARAKRLLEHYEEHPPLCPTCGEPAAKARAHGAAVQMRCSAGHQWTVAVEKLTT